MVNYNDDDNTRRRPMCVCVHYYDKNIQQLADVKITSFSKCLTAAHKHSMHTILLLRNGVEYSNLKDIWSKLIALLL